MPLLAAYAEKRGWLPADAQDPQWTTGLVDEMDDLPILHPAVLALQSDTKELDRRLWRAQLPVVFPYIEDVRTQAVETMRPMIHLPFTTSYEVITDARDLEIGPLLSIARTHQASQELIRRLDCLARMCHALAHLKPARFGDLVKSGMVPPVRPDEI